MTVAEVKIALGITTTDSGITSELTDLIAAAEIDLGIAGVEPASETALVRRAIITYCKLHFGEVEDKDWDRLKASYDEQKAQMSMATNYTDWGDDDE